jgi:hypothetical protein
LVELAFVPLSVANALREVVWRVRGCSGRLDFGVALSKKLLELGLESTEFLLIGRVHHTLDTLFVGLAHQVD